MVGDRVELLEIQRAYGITRSLRLLPGRARPEACVHGGQRQDARARRSRAGGADPLRPPRPRRVPHRGGHAVHRPRRARDQAPPEGPALPSRRPETRARVRARGGTVGTDPHPRRSRAAPHRRLTGPPARPPQPAGADRRPRRHRRPGGDGEELRRTAGRLLRHVCVEPPRPARSLPARPAGAGRLRVRLPVRAPAELPADGSTHRARVRAGRRRAPGPLPRHGVAHRGRPRSPRADDAARRDAAFTPRHIPPHQPVPHDGLGDAVGSGTRPTRTA